MGTISDRMKLGHVRSENAMDQIYIFQQDVPC